MEFLINPYQSAGDLVLGMTDKEIQAVLGAPKDIKIQGWDNTQIHTFDQCYVYFDGNNICEAIELFKPAEVLFDSKNLLSEPYNAIREEFAIRDKQLEHDEVGLTSIKYGIELYAPYSDDEPTHPAESVIVFSKGFYDKK